MGPHNVAESSLLQTRFEIRFNMTAFHSGGGEKEVGNSGEGGKVGNKSSWVLKGGGEWERR